MSAYLPKILIWLFFSTLVCVFVHGAKKAKRSMDAVEEARRNIRWPAAKTEETRNT